MTGFTLTSPTVANYLWHIAKVGETTDAGAELALGVTRSAICAARVLCQRAGLVEWTGKKAPFKIGQPPKIWRLTEAGSKHVKR